MKLKRLIVQGFKSFKDRTVINFDDGITGIVGPNGCGKSNIVDALFWVMGEQSAKHLRGNTMKDVIFSGSSRYSPGAFAEATLVLENNEGKHIHIGNKVSSPSEIQLTRKLYRNGESEYRINKNPARLKDIQEVFMDTGAGAKSYSIIAQGEINRLVQAKPQERRTMIEEVAGVTKFKIRKRESLRKIEQTQLNLGRLQDLKTEIDKNLKILQKQAEKAQRARTLKEKVKRNEIIVQSHKVYEFLKAFRDGKVSLDERGIELESWSTEKDSLEISLQQERLQKDELTEKIENLQSEFNQLSKQLAASEERFTHLCRSLSEKENEKERRKEELDQFAAELDERSSKREDLLQALNEMQSEDHEGVNYSELEEEVESLKEQLELKSEQLQDYKNSVQEKRQELQELEQEIFRNTSKIEDYSSNLEDMAQEIESLEKQYSGVSGKLSNQRDEVFQLEKEVEELSQKESHLNHQLKEVTQNYREQGKIATEKSRELIHKESKVLSLREVNESMEGAKEGASSFLKSESGKGFDLFGKTLKCSDEYTQVVQTLLAPHIDALVCIDGQEENLWAWKESHSEAFDFLKRSLDNTTSFDETKERLKIRGFGSVRSLDEVIDLPTELRKKFKSLLSGFFVVDELDSEKVKELEEGFSFYAISNLKGTEVLKLSDGAVTYSRPSENESHGVIARNNTIEALEKEIVLLKQETEQKETDVASLEKQLEQINQELTTLRESLSDKKSDLAAKKSVLQSNVENLESGSERLEILKRRHSDISKNRLELLEKEEELTAKKVSLIDEKSNIEEMVETHHQEWEDLKSQYEEKREQYVQLEVQAKSYQQRLEGFNSQIEDISGQIERLMTRKDGHQTSLLQYESDIEKINGEITELEEMNQNRAGELSQREEVLSDLKDNLSELLVAMQEREEQVKSLTSQISKAEKEMVETQSKIERLRSDEQETVRNIFEKYRIDLRESLCQFLEVDDSVKVELENIDEMYMTETENGPVRIEGHPFEFHRRYGQDLKECEVKLKNYRQEYNRLGEINWQAIEDYDRQKMRFDFLQAQERELRQSLEDLEVAIEHIDQKSKERFKVAFDEVNMRFEKVFPIIFGGGNAELKVVGDINDPECGVDIVAQPPGKKMQNINLMSGGEKALTAVSLIFSIFLVKPSPFCLLDEVDAPLDDANVGRFNELLREMSHDSQFILITHNKKTMELNDTLYGVTMQEAGVSKAVSVQLH